MKCLRCKSVRTLKFIDGFGQRRIFCRNCGGSFLEDRVIKFNNQKNLIDFSLDMYHKLGFHK
jgi:hypothetical protein